MRPVDPKVACLFIDLILDCVERRDLDVCIDNVGAVGPGRKAMPGVSAVSVEFSDDGLLGTKWLRLNVRPTPPPLAATKT